jgi:hypothetical protein
VLSVRPPIDVSVVLSVRPSVDVSVVLFIRTPDDVSVVLSLRTLVDVSVMPSVRTKLYVWMSCTVVWSFWHNRAYQRIYRKDVATHHFFRNVCTKSGSLRFSQFCGCWLILSVYEFWLSFCKIVRSSVILLLPLCIIINIYSKNWEIQNKYHTVGKVPKSKMVETEAKCIPLTHIYMTVHLLGWE